ncbi:MAG: DUF5615 family PIN-like protein [Blastocatellia bacterium]
MIITLYLDEDSQDSDLVRALRLRGVDVLTSSDSGMNGRKDEEQLVFATSYGRSLYSFNSKDFYQLHTSFLAQSRTHAGLILGPQQELSIGEQMRRLLKIIASLSGEEMIGRVEFMGTWR